MVVAPVDSRQGLAGWRLPLLTSTTISYGADSFAEGVVRGASITLYNRDTGYEMWEQQVTTMRIGLFVPCYIDQLYPDVALATLELLEKAGMEVEFPSEQTCCGQPMANTGCERETRPLAFKFLKVFRDYPYVVCPSGSCVAMVRHHYREHLAGQPGFEELVGRTYELCEFLVDVLKMEPVTGSFPHKVGIHQSCHALRSLRIASSSELVGPTFSKMRHLLERLDGIELSQLERSDECCGFGGTFSISEEAVSCQMGLDRLADHERAGTEVLTAPDMSCLMHLAGLMRRRGTRMHVMHIAQILAGRQVPNGHV
ncbi:MAG: (Fe-S)-binding protein [Pirellulaceae bacterium]